ncbi:MAG: hydantoinase B/oxoprolinase family protein [Actinobacteria bacterium]|nr:hydantoinase B/oxoprolinase family protein [Actinomycetota bacterium]
MKTAGDAITAEVVRAAFALAAEEAGIVVVRAAHSTFIAEGADACATVLDTRGRLVAQSAATTLMHGASLRATLPALLEDVPLDGMRPGDVYVTNDPYRGGIHANDLLVFRPVFAGRRSGGVGGRPGRRSEVDPNDAANRPTWFAGTLIHVADVGGVAAAGLAALATDVFAEGLLLPPVALVRQGEAVPEVWRILERNSRSPDRVLGDVRALVAGVNVMTARIEELVDGYGVDAVAAEVDGSIDYARTRMRDELRRLPRGRYHGSFAIEGDGVDPDRTYDVRVTVDVGDGDVSVDFDGTSPQARGSINSSTSQTLSAVVYAIRCFVDPTIPMNEGCFEPVRVRAPRGCLVNPDPPAACGGRIVTMCAAIEAIIAALAEARPDHAVAASSLIHVYALAGASDGGRPWLTLGYEFGGIGARNGADGPDATGPYVLGGRSVITQVEPLEASLPVLVREYRLRADSGGPGTFRGGLGVETTIEVLSDATLTSRGDRIALPPRGSHGGAHGEPGRSSVHRTAGEETLDARAAGVALRAGDRYVLRTSGGGGFGPPRRRDPAAVLADVLDGRCTPAHAEQVYGVVLDTTGVAVDEQATARLRTDAS